MENPVIILGAGIQGRKALDIFTQNDVVVYCFLDDDASLHNSEIGIVPVLGDTDDDGFLKLIGAKCEVFVALSNISERRNAVEMLLERRKVMPCNAIHSTANISSFAHLGHGNLIDGGVHISPEVELGNHCQIEAGSIIDAKTSLADFVQVGIGVRIGAECSIGEGAFIGAGAVIIPGIKIGAGASIGAGSVVVEHVPGNSMVFGNPAKKV